MSWNEPAEGEFKRAKEQREAADVLVTARTNFSGREST
ncbi:hypothetical protein YSA_09309 [Pseudomonas putida ND6]|uniref:Uncharacterized protein n=1 Tax=Pseudomonas putida ND6 TaxID=231023 RepID=I3V235_PSEPU|nr:hypothetical protein YSA_09309 [Pseudomonas putida ND6]